MAEATRSLSPKRALERLQQHRHCVIALARHSAAKAIKAQIHDTRSLAHYLGHRNLQSTARYTALAPDRFAKFWQD